MRRTFWSCSVIVGLVAVLRFGGSLREPALAGSQQPGAPATEKQAHSGGPRLELRPAFYFRHYESAVNEGLPAPYHLSAIEDRYEVSAAQSELPPLRMKLANDDAQFTVSPQSIHQVFYRVEQSRGYAYEGELWSPGFFVVDMQERDLTAIIASTEAWDIINVLTPETALAAEEERRAKMLDEALPEARSKFAAELVFAGDQFIITPAGRFEEAARANCVSGNRRQSAWRRPMPGSSSSRRTISSPERDRLIRTDRLAVGSLLATTGSASGVATP